MGANEHRKKAKVAGNGIGFAVLTVSDTRNEKTDDSGTLIRDMVIQAGHKVIAYRVVKDEASVIKDAVQTFVDNADVSVLVVNGGTGISRRDVTVETLEPFLEKKLNGFGELFRHLSYQEIGATAMVSRAIAGTIKRKIVFLLPGSTNAVRLAIEKLILPEVQHIVWELER